MDNLNEGSTLMALCAVVFFAGMAWYLLDTGSMPRWAVIVTGVASALLSLSALLVLV